jgi:transposase
MHCGPHAIPITLTDDERTKLTDWSRRPTSAQRLALRAHIVLAAAAGRSNTAIAADLRVTLPNVRKWRDRFAAVRLEGLADEPRPGTPRGITDAQVEAAVTRTLETRPADATHWSTRTLARHLGLSQTAISRIWRAFGLKPHRQESFKLSIDPFFVEKVRDIVGLYVNPPDHRGLPAMSQCPPPTVRLDQGCGPHPAQSPEGSRTSRSAGKLETSF